MRCENRGAYRRYADPAVGIGAGSATFISQAWLRRKTGAATALRATVAVSSLRALLQSATMQPPGLVADEGSRANGSPHLSGGTDTSAHAEGEASTPSPGWDPAGAPPAAVVGVSGGAGEDQLGRGCWWPQPRRPRGQGRRAAAAALTAHAAGPAAGGQGRGGAGVHLGRAGLPTQRRSLRRCC